LGPSIDSCGLLSLLCSSDCGCSCEQAREVDGTRYGSQRGSDIIHRGTSREDGAAVRELGDTWLSLMVHSASLPMTGSYGALQRAHVAHGTSRTGRCRGSMGHHPHFTCRWTKSAGGTYLREPSHVRANRRRSPATSRVRSLPSIATSCATCEARRCGAASACYSGEGVIGATEGVLDGALAPESTRSRLSSPAQESPCVEPPLRRWMARWQSDDAARAGLAVELDEDVASCSQRPCGIQS
jgi:hypothetical protein